MINSFWLAMVILCLLVLILFVLFVRNRQQLNELQSKQASYDLLSSDIQIAHSTLEKKLAVLTSATHESTTENDQVTKQLEHRIKQVQLSVKSLEELIESIQSQESQDKFYSRANKLAALGADIEEIMRECELPRAEVEILLALYQKNNET